MHRKNTTGRRRMLAAFALAAIAPLAIVACGDDDEDTTAATAATAAPAATDAPAATEAAPATAAPGAAEDFTAFCQAELHLEATISEDGGSGEMADEIGAAFGAVAESAPASASGLVNETIAAAQAFMQAGTGPSDEFLGLYGQMVGGVVADNCGFADLDVTATEYKFSGVPETMPAGPIVLTFTNDGLEYHEMSIFRINDGVELTPSEILALDEEESATKVTEVNGAFAAPGTVGYTVTELEPGHYFAACHFPMGTTAEVYAATAAGGPEPTGAPHFTAGMVSEFEVTG